MSLFDPPRRELLEGSDSDAEVDDATPRRTALRFPWEPAKPEWDTLSAAEKRQHHVVTLMGPNQAVQSDSVGVIWYASCATKEEASAQMVEVIGHTHAHTVQVHGNWQRPLAVLPSRGDQTNAVKCAATCQAIATEMHATHQVSQELTNMRRLMDQNTRNGVSNDTLLPRQTLLSTLMIPSWHTEVEEKIASGEYDAAACNVYAECTLGDADTEASADESAAAGDPDEDAVRVEAATGAQTEDEVVDSVPPPDPATSADTREVHVHELHLPPARRLHDDLFGVLFAALAKDGRSALVWFVSTHRTVELAQAMRGAVTNRCRGNMEAVVVQLGRPIILPRLLHPSTTPLHTDMDELERDAFQSTPLPWDMV